MLFFSRATRLPQWMPAQRPVVNSPITLAVDPPIAGQVRERVLSSIAAQLRYAVFNIEFAGVPYQIVASISYADPLRAQLDSVSGFTVNLDWERNGCFADILSEIAASSRVRCQ